MQLNKKLLFDSAAREELLAGVNILADAVKTTMGPNGQNVVIERQGMPPILTKDGVAVARSINLKEQFKNLGAQMVKEAASRTAEVAGDGTTTATILTQALFSEGLRLLAAGYSSSELRAGMDYATREVIKNLKKMSIPITEDEEIINVGTISANGDRSIGKFLCQAMNAVGRNGIISVEDARGFETSLDIVDGLELNRGYLSPYFVTNHNKLVSELENPKILLVNRSISNISEILPLLEEIHREQQSLLIVADDVDGEALKALVVNHLKGVLRLSVIRSPEFGQSRIEALEDLALLFDTTVVSSAEQLPDRITNLGTCKKVEIYRNKSVFIGVDQEEDNIKERVDSLQGLLEDPALSTDEVAVIKRRISRLSGGVAVIRVGGATELELQERKDRVDDALNATKAAVEEGILAGGGAALAKASLNIKVSKSQTVSFKVGVAAVEKACKMPFQQIVKNVGGCPEIILHKILELDENSGYDARSDKFTNMFESGIIDPLKVVRSALENANSSANALLSVGCAIVDDGEEREIETLI